MSPKCCIFCIFVFYYDCGYSMGKFYTVSEVATKLNLHPRTIRRKISSGEIQAVRVGKQYRLTQEQVGILYGAHTPGIPKRMPSVSSVIEIEPISEHQSMELHSKITSIFFSGSFQGRMYCSHNSELQRLKVFIDCALETAPDVLALLNIHIHSLLAETFHEQDI